MIEIGKYIFRKYLTSSSLSKLKIKVASVDSEGDPFVTLENGLTFYGAQPTQKEKKFYHLFTSASVKKKLPFECFHVAIDIQVRYFEGNLKWGGPAKEAYYQVKEHDTIAEMGAFRGYYTLFLSQKVGPKGKVIAIEPIPENLRYLRKNIEANHIKNVTIVERGVWNKDEIKRFQRKNTDFQSGSIDMSYSDQEAIEIEVNTLDTILKKATLKKLTLC